MRPPLTKSISLEDFQNYYWLKAELQTFCRENGLPASGSKIEITDCISHYLTTGKVLKTALGKKCVKLPSLIKTFLFKRLLLTITAVAKMFVLFQRKIGTNFRFTVALQKFFKENVGKTYEDAVAFGMKKTNEKKTLHTKQLSVHNLNTIALLVTFRRSK